MNGRSDDSNIVGVTSNFVILGATVEDPSTVDGSSDDLIDEGANSDVVLLGASVDDISIVD